MNIMLSHCKRFTIFLVIFSLFSMHGYTKSIDLESLSKYAEKTLTEWGSAGAAITIVQDGKVIYTKCFGVTTAGGNTPITDDTQFMIVSSGKGITAFLLTRLQEAGILNLSDPVIKYLPDFKLYDHQTTQEFQIQDLVSHNSGLPDFSFDSLVETGWSEDEIYQVLDRIPPIHDFRETFGYQNIFPGIAGKLAQKVLNQPLSEIYKTYVFDPLGFQDTTIGQTGLTGGENSFLKLKANIKSWFQKRVSEHFLLDHKPQIIRGDNPAIYRFPGSRGINASIRDMAKWLQFWQTGKGKNNEPLLTQDLMEIFFQKKTNVGTPRGGTLFPKGRVTDISYGLGWYIHNYANLDKVYSHMGGMTGTRSLIVMVPEQNIGMVILINVGGMRVSLAPEAIRSKFLDLLTDQTDNRDWSQELMQESSKYRDKIKEQMAEYKRTTPQKAHELDAYVGSYKNNLYGTIQITKEPITENNHITDKLFIHYRDLKAPLNHFNGDTFNLYPPSFSKAYSGTDICNILFGYDPRSEKAKIMKIDLLSEGIDTNFYRE